jgi:hypothetical protein
MKVGSKFSGLKAKGRWAAQRDETEANGIRS